MNTTTLKKFTTTHPYITALLFYIVINLVGGYSITLFVNIKEVYTALNTPWWAPATWVFGAAWTINNILVLLGNIATLKAPVSRNRTTLIRLQIATWINYSVFQWLSFGTGIPAMFFVPTFTMLLLTLASIYYAYKIDTTHTTLWHKVKSFKSIAFSFSTLIVWLAVATVLGCYIMMNN
jgi:tryptophan-rich sensory protein